MPLKFWWDWGGERCCLLFQGMLFMQSSDLIVCRMSCDGVSVHDGIPGSYCCQINPGESQIERFLRNLMADLRPCGSLSANRWKSLKRLQWESWWCQMCARNDAECEKILRFISPSAATVEMQRNLEPETIVSRSLAFTEADNESDTLWSGSN
jgi:hypothetical protein